MVSERRRGRFLVFRFWLWSRGLFSGLGMTLFNFKLCCVAWRGLPYSTVKRVDCMVCEQYNSKTLRAKSTLLTERSNLAGVASGDRG